MTIFDNFPRLVAMVEILFPKNSITSLSVAELLSPGEVVAVVDDSAEIVLLLTHYLTNQGFTVVSAGNASRFYELLAAEKIALVLLDIGLPDQSGYEILKDIAPNHPDLGIIMVTGTTDISSHLIVCARELTTICLNRSASTAQLHRPEHPAKTAAGHQQSPLSTGTGKNQCPDAVSPSSHLKDEHRLSQYR